MHVTYSCGERVFDHHRSMGMARSSDLQAPCRHSKNGHFLGGQPLWQVFRSTFQLTKRPYVFGGLALMARYLCCWITAHERPVSPELMKFYRGEQMAGLKQLLRRRALFSC
jgi:hypothetical protein